MLHEATNERHLFYECLHAQYVCSWKTWSCLHRIQSTPWDSWRTPSQQSSRRLWKSTLSGSLSKMASWRTYVPVQKRVSGSSTLKRESWPHCKIRWTPSKQNRTLWRWVFKARIYFSILAMTCIGNFNPYMVCI